MKYLIILAILFTSCKKDVSYDLVKVSQGGESVLIQGYLTNPLPYDFAYSIKVVECGVVKERGMVVIKAGETYGEHHYQTDCKIGRWDIVYAEKYVQ